MKRLRAKLAKWLTEQSARFLPDVKSAFDNQRELGFARDRLEEMASRERNYRADYMERAAELVEARQMRGAGPWLVAENRASIDGPQRYRESNPITSQGAFNDIELALQNVEWRREVNLSWLEFSRWGIQQIILISRLYWIKNPLIQRGVNTASDYVFGRGVETTSTDDSANEVLKGFFERNKKSLGLIALSQHQKALFTDGNLFFCFFADAVNTGEVNVRTIDATEIMDVICDPDDADTPRFYRRVWTQRQPDIASGQIMTEQMEAWYPALEYLQSDPAERPTVIGGREVKWDNPVHHMRGGQACPKWHFDVPVCYAAVDWAKGARKLLEAVLSTKMALQQFAATITTKGGQQAVQGIKGQLQTNVSAQGGNSLWDTNPTAGPGATWVSGPGTVLSAFKTSGAGGDPEEVRRYIHMVAMVFGLPETFYADASTGSLATAQSLDRPTELRFLQWQERWRETLVVIAKYVLQVSGTAENGKLRDSLRKVNVRPSNLVVMESRRSSTNANGRWKYVESPKSPDKIEVRVNFPAIREGDLPALVKAIVESMTLDNKGGQIVGIDEKVGVRLLYEQLGVENPEDILDEQYPADEYDPDRTEQELTAPIPKLQDAPGGTTQLPDRDGNPLPPDKQAQESFKRLLEAARKFGREVA